MPYVTKTLQTRWLPRHFLFPSWKLRPSASSSVRQIVMAVGSSPNASLHAVVVLTNDQASSLAGALDAADQQQLHHVQVTWRSTAAAQSGAARCVASAPSQHLP